MKHLQKSAVALSAFALFAATANAATVEEITASDNANIEFFVSSDVMVDENIEADLKVMKDLLATYAYKDTGEANKVIINLTYDMYKNTSYNLLGITGSEINIDFTAPAEIPGEVMVDDGNVEKINIVDSKTIEVFFKEEPEADEFSFKVLSPLTVESVSGDADGSVDMVVKTPLEEFASYLLIVNSFSDADGESVDFPEMMYEFDTPDYLETVIEPQNLEAANDPSYMLNPEAETQEDGNLAEVAAEAEQTPATGAATWVLLLATLGMSSLFFLRRK